MPQWGRGITPRKTQTHSPPCGHNCRWGTIRLSARQAEARGGETGPIPDDAQADAGWGHNPHTGHGADLAALVRAQLDRLPPALKAAAEPEMLAGMSMPSTPSRCLPWAQDFPDTLIHARLGAASAHPDYAAAKAGDIPAAVRLVDSLLDPQAVEALAQLAADRRPVLVPVHAEEAVSINRIPLAMAERIGRALGWPVETTVVQAAKVSRTGADGFHRLALPPPFDGVLAGQYDTAVILDDTLTQGGTLANLRGHLGYQGVQVIAATVLTGKQYSARLALLPDTLANLRNRHADLEAW